MEYDDCSHSNEIWSSNNEYVCEDCGLCIAPITSSYNGIEEPVSQPIGYQSYLQGPKEFHNIMKKSNWGLISYNDIVVKQLNDEYTTLSQMFNIPMIYIQEAVGQYRKYLSNPNKNVIKTKKLKSLKAYFLLDVLKENGYSLDEFVLSFYDCKRCDIDRIRIDIALNKN
jgi:transcription initiation factor TFIIIB Brf1 subunit/transcription initiation factor TFIIB